MRLTCPHCGCHGSLELWASDADARAVAALAARLPAAAGPAAMRYVSMFRPASRALTWPRARKLLGEIVEWLDAGAIERRGRTWPVTAAALAAAIDQMAANDKLALPLKSHGYLLEILVGIADRGEAAVERAAEAEVRTADAGRRNAIANARADIAARNAWLAERNQPALTPDGEAAIWRRHGLEPPQ